MSLPYFPMYPSNFEAKTSHLTLEEDGAYNRLLRLMWMTPGCSLPDDDKWIARRMRVDVDTFERVVRVVIDEFCTRKNGRVSNARLTEVFEDSNERHSRRVSAGSKGGKAKALKTNDTRASKAVVKPKQLKPEPEPDVREDTNVSSGPLAPKKRATRLSENWFLPTEWGQWAVSQGWPEPVIRMEAEKFRDYWIGVGGQKGAKLDWQATWRNWMRNCNSPKAINGGFNAKSPKSDPQLDIIIKAARAR